MKLVNLDFLLSFLYKHFFQTLISKLVKNRKAQLDKLIFPEYLNRSAALVTALLFHLSPLCFRLGASKSHALAAQSHVPGLQQEKTQLTKKKNSLPLHVLYRTWANAIAQ